MPAEPESLRNGDPAAASLAAILREQLPALRAFVRLRLDPELRMRESCSDIVQSVMGDLLEQEERFEFRGDAQLRAWLYTSVLNKLREKRRYHLAERRAPSRERLANDDDALRACYARIPTPSQVAMTREGMAQLETAFDGLPEHYREVLTLSRIAGLSQEETARQMGRTVASTRNLLSRALARLASRIDRQQPSGA